MCKVLRRHFTQLFQANSEPNRGVNILVGLVRLSDRRQSAVKGRSQQQRFDRPYCATLGSLDNLLYELYCSMLGMFEKVMEN